MVSKELTAIKTSVKHTGDFCGFFENGDIEVKIKDKNFRFHFLNEDVANFFRHIGLGFGDEIIFLSTKRSKIITHYLRSNKSNQLTIV